VTRSFHIICALFALFLFWGLALNASEGVPILSMIHIVLLFLLSLAGAVYRDSWDFDTEMNTVTSTYGFAWMCKREQYAFDEVERLELTHFVRGRRENDAKPTKRKFRAMIVFSLRLTDDQLKTIEIIAEKTSGGRTESAMQAIGAVSGLPLYVDRPRDMDLNVSYKDL
jgi:hypothetical protein